MYGKLLNCSLFLTMQNLESSQRKVHATVLKQVKEVLCHIMLVIKLCHTLPQDVAEVKSVISFLKGLRTTEHRILEPSSQEVLLL